MSGTLKKKESSAENNFSSESVNTKNWAAWRSNIFFSLYSLSFFSSIHLLLLSFGQFVNRWAKIWKTLKFHPKKKRSNFVWCKWETVIVFFHYYIIITLSPYKIQQNKRFLERDTFSPKILVCCYCCCWAAVVVAVAALNIIINIYSFFLSLTV